MQNIENYHQREKEFLSKINKFKTALQNSENQISIKLENEKKIQEENQKQI